MQCGGRPSGDDALAAGPQPSRYRIEVDGALCLVGDVHTWMDGGVVPAQLAPREPAAADFLSTDECLPHARMLTATADRTATSSPTSAAGLWIDVKNSP